MPFFLLWIIWFDTDTVFKPDLVPFIKKELQIEFGFGFFWRVGSETADLTTSEGKCIEYNFSIEVKPTIIIDNEKI